MAVLDTATAVQVALSPERERLLGPVVARLLRRAGIGAAVVWAAALVPLLTDASPRWKAIGLGLLLPGGGFLYTSDPVLVLVTLVAFGLAFVAWFGSGNLLAPPLVWAGAALLAALRTHTGLWDWAEWVVPAVLGAIVVSGLVGERTAFRAARGRAVTRNRYLADARMAPAATRAAVAAECSETDLAVARRTLDLALQPIDAFEGYDWIDQFQTAAVRYQINFQSYGLALLQQDRLPAFTGYLAQAQRNLIEKMTNKRVWRYWFWENLWGNLDPNPDPIPRDNIMVSGYLGLMLGAYEGITGDHRYGEPGSITFRWNSRRSFPHDFHTIAEAVYANFVRSPFAMFPCEPNWVYSACNTFGMNTLLLHDRLHGTTYAPEIGDRYRRSLDEEFLTPDGRMTAIRSSRLGLTIPMLTSTMADAGMALFLSPILPDIARRTWQVVRTEFVSIPDGGRPVISLRGWDKMDVGNYRRSDVSPHAIVATAAREMGDDELYEALQASVDERFEPVLEDGALRYTKASTQANAMLAMARFGRGDAFRDLVCGVPGSDGQAGPVLADAPYPDVLVARAVSDGRDLDLVLRPGRSGGRYRLRVERLDSDREYRIVGAVEETVRSGPDGAAEIDVDLDGRSEVRVAPASR